MSTKPWITTLLRWVLALIFMVAAGLKLGNAAVGRMDDAGAASTMFGELPAVAKWGLVAAEFALAVWLVGAWRLRWAAFITIVLLSTFLGAIVWEMGKPEPRSCGCLGTAAVDPAAVRKALAMSLTLDTLMLGAALWVYFDPRNRAVLY